MWRLARSKNMKVLILVLALFICPPLLLAQASAKVSKKPAPPSPFDTAATRITSSMFVSPSALVQRIAVAPRSEFETTAAFEQRVRGQLDTQFYAIRITCSYAGGSYDLNRGGLTKLLEYNADRGEYMIDLGTAGTEYDEQRNAVGDLLLECTEAQTGSYSGANAFGVKKTVKKMVGRQYEIAYPVPQEIAFSKEMKFALPFPADSASKLKPFIRAAVVIRPGMNGSGPPVWTVTNRVAPKIARPVDYTTIIKKIFAPEAFVWIYDNRSGRVLGKYDFVRFANEAN
jgi:hypothetical protein